MMNASLVQHTSVRDETLAVLTRLGATESALAGEGIPATSPITGELILARFHLHHPGTILVVSATWPAAPAFPA